MIGELLGALGPALPALGIMGAILLLWIVWAVRTRPRPRHRRVSAAAIRAQKIEEIDNSARTALSPASASAIDIARVVECLEPFDLATFLDQARALHVAAQQARATGPTAALEEGLYPVALEHSLASGPGLDEVTEVGLVSAHVVKASGSPAGCGIDVVFTSVVGEVLVASPSSSTRRQW